MCQACIAWISNYDWRIMGLEIILVGDLNAQLGDPCDERE